MVEPSMIFGIGFLVAVLLTISVIPLVHARAVRLTTKRLEALTPVSMAEIQADKDQLRAEFAMSTRRLEMSVEQMRARTTSQLAELSKKSEAISALKTELAEKTTALNSIEARERSMKERMAATEEEFAVKSQTLRDAEQAFAAKKTEMELQAAELEKRAAHSDSERAEVVAARMQVEGLKLRVEHSEREVKEVEARLAKERAQAAAAAEQIEHERSRLGDLDGRMRDLEHLLVAQTTEAELVNKRAQELESRLAEQGRLLAEKDYELGQLRAEVTALTKREAELRAALDNTDERHKAATQSLRDDKTQAEEQFKQADQERSRLLAEIAALKRSAESSWADERVENALLRERINDVAAEVARLASALEGPGSPIDAILAAEAARVPAPGEAALANGDAKGTLADRIRALQTRASRTQPAN